MKERRASAWAEARASNTAVASDAPVSGGSAVRTEASLGQRTKGRGEPLSSRKLAAITWMVTAATLFSVMGVCTRLAARRLPWSEIAAACALIGVGVAIAVARARGVSLAIHDRRVAWARSVLGTAAVICTFYTLGTPQIALGDAVTLGAMAPVFIALLSPFLLGERSGRGVWIATSVAFVGAALIASPSFRLSGALAGIALLGAMLTALAMISLRRLVSGVSGAARQTPEAIVVHFSVVAGVVLSLLALPTLRAPDPASGLCTLVAGASAAFAQMAMTRAYGLDHAACVGVWDYLKVLLTHVGAVVILGEAESLLRIVGAGLVVAAGVLLGWSGARAARVPVGACQTGR